MEKLLQPYDFFEAEFVEAVDGRLFSQEEKKQYFDVKKAFKRYGRECKPGEIGCTLSHQKCYKKLVESSDDYVLILEDDIALDCFEKEIFERVERFISKSVEATIVLLSGNYWYWGRKKRLGIHNLMSVFDAYGTFAYVINRKAAQKLLDVPVSFLADDWRYLKARGIKLMALYPHLINTVIESEVSSTIFSSHQFDRGMIKSNLSIMNRLCSYWRGGIRHILSLLGKYEKVG